jgi:phosphoribosylglycinamide formyltransferase-1
MRALIENSRDSPGAYRVTRVISDNAQAAGLATACDLGVPAQSIPNNAISAKSISSHGPQGRADFERILSLAVATEAPDLIVLAGFMRILSAEFVRAHEGRIMNIHPSLLPKFPGLHTHRRVLAAHETHHGATVHFVTEELDGGPPIIQARVAVTPSDDETSLAKRVQEKEHEIYPLAVRWFCEGRLRFAEGRAWLDGQPLTQPVQLEAARC